MELVKHEIGSEAVVTVELVAGDIVIKGNLGTSGLGAEVKATVNGDYFLDLLASKIPGQIDDAVINLLKSALKSV
jgi:hypothetical protein